MMIQRHRRHEMPSRPDIVLGELKRCRDAMIALHCDLNPRGVAYRAVAGVVAAIDAFAGVLTGDARHFAIKTTPASRYDGEGDTQQSEGKVPPR